MTMAKLENLVELISARVATTIVTPPGACSTTSGKVGAGDGHSYQPVSTLEAGLRLAIQLIS